MSLKITLVSKFLVTLAATASLLIFSSTLGATETVSPQSDQSYSNSKRICFYSDAANSFNPIDEQHLMVRVSASKRYLLTLSHPCRNLRQTPQIVFGSRGGLICNYTRSRISTGEEKCTIADIQRVGSYSEARTLARLHNDTLSENFRRHRK